MAESIKFSWDKVEDAVLYEIEVYSAPDLTGRLKIEQLTKPTTKITSGPGQIFFRVRYKDAYSRWSDFSNISTITIKPKKIPVIVVEEKKPSVEVKTEVVDEVTKTEKPSYLVKKRLVFLPLLKFAQFKGKVRSSSERYSLTSMPNVGFQLSWIEKFSDQFSLSYNFQYQSYRFMVPEDTTLLNSNLSEESLGIGLTYHLSENWSLINDLSYESMIYLNPIESGQVSLDRSNTLVNRARVSYQFCQTEGLTTSVYGGWAYSFANSAKSFKADANSGLFAGIQARKDLRDKKLGIVGLFEYSKEGRDTSRMTQALEDYTLGLGMDWKF